MPMGTARPDRLAADGLVVVGGGIGGLRAALGLQRHGFRVSVYERTPAFADVGAGLTLTPPALRALDALGVLDPTLVASDDVARTAFLDHATGELLRIAEPRSPVQGGTDATEDTRVIHRSDMHAILLEAALSAGVDVHAGCELTGIDQDEGQAIAIFADGRVARGALVIGCDGLRSALRQTLHGNDALRDVGLVAWRALVPAERLAGVIDAYHSAVHLGPGATFVRYHVRHGALVNCVAIVRTDAVAADSWSTRSTRAELKGHLQGWSGSVLDLIDRISDEDLYKWPLLDRDPLPGWTDRRVTLLGDAAHPMLPFLGIGAAMAMEDAVILSRAVAAAGAGPAALLHYQQARIDRATEVMLASRRQGETMLASTVAQTFRRELPRSGVLDHDVRTEA